MPPAGHTGTGLMLSALRRGCTASCWPVAARATGRGPACKTVGRHNAMQTVWNTEKKRNQLQQRRNEPVQTIGSKKKKLNCTDIPERGIAQTFHDWGEGDGERPKPTLTNEVLLNTLLYFTRTFLDIAPWFLLSSDGHACQCNK